jgi:DNA-binding CsgD family transcriptional regulator
MAMANVNLQRRFTDDIVSQIVIAKTSDDVVAALGKLSGDLGFRCFRTDYVPRIKSQRTVSYSNQPEKWAAQFHAMSAEDASKDPVWKHLERSTLPLVWGQDTYRQAGLAEFYEQFSVYGLVSGACLALRGPKNEMLAIGFSSDEPQPGMILQPDIFGVLYLASATILEHALAVIGVSPSLEHLAPLLTRREKEVMKWSAEGKTAWEIGQILNVTAATVQFHVKNSVEKLGAINKQHAIVRALHLGII